MGRLYGNATQQLTDQAPNSVSQGSGRLFGSGSSTPSTGAQTTSDLNPITRLLSNDAPGKKKISAYTPLDYLLNSAVYGGAGILKSAFGKAKALKKRQQQGEDVPLLEKLTGPSVLNPENWSGALENLKPENRRSAFDVTKEELPNNPYAATTAFIGDLAAPAPSIAKVAKLTGIDTAAIVVGETRIGK